MRPTAAEVAGASTAELVEAVAVIVGELAGRPAPESPAACMELAETLGWSLDQSEAALAGLVRRVAGSAEPQRWGYSGPLAWLRHRLGMRTGRAKERLRLATAAAVAPDRQDLTSLCARLYGRRSAKNRARKALEAAERG